VKVAVAAGFDASEQPAPRSQFVSRVKLAGAVVLSKRFTYHLLNFFNRSRATIVEKLPAEIRQHVDHRPACNDDHLWIKTARIGGEVKKPIEVNLQARQHQHVWPAEQSRVLKRSAEQFTVKTNFTEATVEAAGNKRGRHGLRKAPRPSAAIAVLVKPANDHQNFLHYSHWPAPSRRFSSRLIPSSDWRLSLLLRYQALINAPETRFVPVNVSSLHNSVPPAWDTKR